MGSMSGIEYRTRDQVEHEQSGVASLDHGRVLISEGVEINGDVRVNDKPIADQLRIIRAATRRTREAGPIKHSLHHGLSIDKDTL